MKCSVCRRMLSAEDKGLIRAHTHMRVPQRRHGNRRRKNCDVLSAVWGWIFLGDGENGGERKSERKRERVGVRIDRVQEEIFEICREILRETKGLVLWCTRCTFF